MREAEHAMLAHFAGALAIPDYIPPEWHSRIRVEVDDRGIHYLWTGWNNGEGHGKVSIAGKPYYTHRLVYERHHGVRLSRFDFIDHLCERKACLNRDHLEAVPPSINTYRGPGRHSQFRPKEAYL